MAASENEVLLCTSKTKHGKRRQKWIMNVTSTGKKNTFEGSEKDRK